MKNSLYILIGLSSAVGNGMATLAQLSPKDKRSVKCQPLSPEKLAQLLKKPGAKVVVTGATTGMQSPRQ